MPGAMAGSGYRVPMTENTTVKPGWVDLNNAAVYLSVSVPTIRRLIAARKLPAHRVGTKLLRIRVSDLDKLALEGAV